METKQTTQKKNKYYKTLKLVFGLKITTGHQTVTKVETQKFQHGSSEVPAKVQERSRKFPRARFQHKSDKVPRKVPARFQHRFQEGSKWFQEGSSTVPAIFQQRSSKVPARLQARFQQGSSTGSKKVPKGSRKVPAQFQQSSNNDPARFQQGCEQGSSKVPGLFRFFRFFRACIFASPLPAPRDWNPTDSLLGINTYLNNPQ